MVDRINDNSRTRRAKRALAIQVITSGLILTAYALAWIFYGFPLFLILIMFGTGMNLENVLKK
jgi:hypothetical protein